MSPNDLAQDVALLRASGFSEIDFTRLHHFALVGRPVSMKVAINYFEAKSSLRGRNIQLGERCRYVAIQLGHGRTDKEALIEEALERWPLSPSGELTSERPPVHARQPSGPLVIRTSSSSRSKRLGDAGEALALEMLLRRGYQASLLPTNYPTYDIRASTAEQSFFVSVKVARARLHLRLGARKAVERLSEGNFIFAFLPRGSGEVDLASGEFRLLILPARELRDHALPLHDAYWAARGRPDGYSVMIKAYDLRHSGVWQRWSSYQDAWALLPRTKA